MSSLPPDEPPRLRARERGRARRRLQFLRRARELQLRDAGGFVFELYRFGEQRDGLVREKLDVLIATDKEIRALETLLGQAEQGREIRQPGVGGACPSCGAFHATDSGFCSACGAALGASPEVPERVSEEEPVAEEPVAEEEPTVEEELTAEETAPPEAEGEVTIVRQPDVESSTPNGAGDAEAIAGANGQVPADQPASSDEPDPDTDEAAAVAPHARPRARRGRARRRRGPDS